MKIDFFLDIIPPTVTHQEKAVRVVRGRPIFYEPERLKDARRLLESHLYQHKPSNPIDGPIELTCIWYFPIKEKLRDGIRYKTTKPDTDNIQKLLKDCMTSVGYWNDDAQVVYEHCMKLQSNSMCGIYIEISKMDAIEEAVKEGD